MKPYVYKTTDYGQTWTALPAQDSGVRGYAHVIKEDTVNRNVLFLGTEFGLWISVDGGQRWAQYKGTDFPAVPVDDIVVQAAGIRSGAGDARTRHLDRRRYFAAARSHARK